MALIMAAGRGHKDTVELLLDRGADLEATDDVSAVVGRFAARLAARGVTGRCGTGGGDSDDASGRRAPVAGRREGRHWQGGVSVGE